MVRPRVHGLDVIEKIWRQRLIITTPSNAIFLMFFQASWRNRLPLQMSTGLVRLRTKGRNGFARMVAFRHVNKLTRMAYFSTNVYKDGRFWISLSLMCLTIRKRGYLHLLKKIPATQRSSILKMATLKRPCRSTTRGYQDMPWMVRSNA